MGRKKISTTIYLEPEQVRRLKRLTENTGVAMSELIRQGVQSILQAREQPYQPEERLRDCLGMVRDRLMNADMRRLVEAAQETVDTMRALRERLADAEGRVAGYQTELLRTRRTLEDVLEEK
jgi:predicted DNA-binding protein